jgi:hypothetical protein
MFEIRHSERLEATSLYQMLENLRENKRNICPQESHRVALKLYVSVFT